MKILVTGATGFLGSHIVDRCIKDGDQVRVLVRETSDLSYLQKYPNLEFIYGGLTNIDVLYKATEGIDLIYHSAARAADWGSRKQFYEFRCFADSIPAGRRPG